MTFLVESDHDSSEAHQFFSEIGIFAYMPSPIESTRTVVWSIDNSLLKKILYKYAKNVSNASNGCVTDEI